MPFGHRQARGLRLDARIKVIEAGGVAFPKRIEDRYRKQLLARAKAMSLFMLEQLTPVLAQLESRDAEKRTDAAELPDVVDLNIADLDGMLRVVSESRLAFTRANKPDEDALRVTANDVDVFNSKQTSKVLRAVTGIDPAPTDELRKLQREWARTNADLITSIDARYFDDVADVVAESVRIGRSSRDLSKLLEQRFNVSQSRAKLIARDQVASLNGQISEDRQTSIGVSRYEWQTSEDERVRPEHRARNGRFFEWSSPPPDGHPGQPINCRCVALPVFDDAKPAPKKAKQVPQQPLAVTLAKATAAQQQQQRVRALAAGVPRTAPPPRVGLPPAPIVKQRVTLPPKKVKPVTTATIKQAEEAVHEVEVAAERVVRSSARAVAAKKKLEAATAKRKASQAAAAKRKPLSKAAKARATKATNKQTIDKLIGEGVLRGEDILRFGGPDGITFNARDIKKTRTGFKITSSDLSAGMIKRGHTGEITTITVSPAGVTTRTKFRESFGGEWESFPDEKEAGVFDIEIV